MARTTPNRIGHRFRYPWNRWCNGETWVAVTGYDFIVPPEHFQAIVRTQARRYGYCARTRRVWNGVEFVITKTERNTA